MLLWNSLKRRSVYRPGGSVLRDQVLFVTFGGNQVSDSPLDICLELQKSLPGLRLIWAVKDRSQSVPEGTERVIVGTTAWFNALAKSRYIVSNNNLPFYFRKSSGQIYLQTWHGTPLKQIGKDILENNLSAAYNNAMAREAKYWDYLISQNSYSSLIFPRAFGFAGRILEHGYPRNDRLAKVSETRRQEIRKSLGISNREEKVVLYAPTWRDTAKDEEGKWASVNNLDASLIPHPFRVLYRGHSNTLESERRLEAGVIDVTNYPDVAELFMVADVLITDYSSVMFDFSVTGKPIIFLCPDIKGYEETRGFYFDFAKLAPGPIVDTSEGVAEALANLDKLVNDYAPKYKSWRKTFNSLEDGKASARVVYTVFHA